MPNSLTSTSYTTADHGPSGSRAPAQPGAGLRGAEEKRAPGAASTILDHPVAQHALTALRHRHTPASDFQVHCRQLLLLLAWEATRTVATATRKVVAAAHECDGRALARPIVFISATRQGLGLSSAVVEALPGVSVGSISLDATDERQPPQARLHMFRAPSLAHASVLLFAPVVATGLSATLALSLLRQSAAKDVALLTFVMSGQGLARIRRNFPDVPVWTGAVDHEWDAKLGPVPGIWNFSERVCG